ncbi:MAG: fatty-acyl-CoA synthase, partial [Actinomycetota bacterium]|nr:fatty-acyl-CoA synthase [Actinomycetota bacterium]
EDDAPLHAMPLDHTAQMHVFMLPWLAVGARNRLVSTPDIPAMLELVETERIGAMFLAPTVWVPLSQHPNFIRHDLSSLRKAYYGASIMPGPVRERIAKALPELGWYNCFGQTEIAPLATVLRPEEHAARPDSCGRAVMFVELRVINLDGTDVEPGGTGEVVYRSPHLCEGYWQKPEETAEAFEGGWFHSGDLAVWHPDGYIELRDRKKDVIISGGENISTIEVEQAIARHPAVLECAVVAIPHETWGERPKAFVTLKPQAAASEAEIIEFCRERLAHFKCPDAVEFCELPKTSTGKVQKYVLRDKEWSGFDRRIH